MAAASSAAAHCGRRNVRAEMRVGDAAVSLGTLGRFLSVFMEGRERLVITVMARSSIVSVSGTMTVRLWIRLETKG